MNKFKVLFLVNINMKRFVEMNSRCLRLLLCGIVLMSVFSCKNGNESNFAGKTWDCRETNVDGTIDIQSFFDHASIFCLEETEKSRIGQIDKVVIQDSLLFVLDWQISRAVFVFDARDGRFICRIGNFGHGRGEYTELYDFAIDRERHLIHLLCERKRILTYDFSGRFIEQKTIGLLAWKIEYRDDKFYLSCYEPGIGGLIVTDTDFNIEKNYLINDPDDPVLILLRSLQLQEDGQLAYRRYLDYNIYSLDENDSLLIRYQIDLGENAVTRSMLARRGEDEQGEIKAAGRLDIKMFVENNVYAWILFFDKNEPQVSILDKKDGKTITLPFSCMRDSALGSFSYMVDTTIGDAFVASIGNDLIRKELIENKDCAYGQNPALYFLHCGK